MKQNYTLHGEGKSMRANARTLGVSRNTVRKYLRYAGVDASVHRSGEEQWQERISKDGPAFLPRLLAQGLTRLSGVTKVPWPSLTDARLGRSGTGGRSSPWCQNP